MKFILLNDIDFRKDSITNYGSTFAISVDDLFLVTAFEIEGIKCSKLTFKDGKQFICIQNVREVLERINEVLK